MKALPLHAMTIHQEKLSATIGDHQDAVKLGEELILELRHHIDEYPRNVEVTFEINRESEQQQATTTKEATR